MARVLLAIPHHTAADREVLERLQRTVAELGHQAIAVAPAAEPLALSNAIKKAVSTCDAVIGLVEGSVPDATVLATLVHARLFRRPALGLRSDMRKDLVDPIVRAVVDDVFLVHGWVDAESKDRIASFLGGVRVFAGALVRDSVPNILKQEGRELRFRQVAEPEYPHVLKRKLVETAQRLEEADFGVEQEEIADLLELLETLINLRKYDKDSLRSIKEGKWRKRGGFAKGYLLDEEPVISSR